MAFMSIRELNLKIAGTVAVYWLLVLMLGFLLIADGKFGFGGGNGSGYGFGDGAGGSGGNTGTGMTADENADGPGEGEDGNTFVGGSPDSSENGVITQDSDSENETTPAEDPMAQTAPTAADAAEQEASAGGKDGVAAAQRELQRAEKHRAPELYGDGVQQSDVADNSPQSKVIGLDEARKGFFGIEASGRSTTLFLMDISGSMDSRTAEGLTRLELLKRNLINELDRLHQAAQKAELKTQVGSFVLATFSSSLKVFPANSQPLSYGSDQDIAMAKQFIAQLNTEGGTEMMDAWKNLMPGLAQGNWCQVVFFLSDGEPTDCQGPELEQFLGRYLPRLNINTFALGTHSQMMENIAKSHGGKHREIR